MRVTRISSASAAAAATILLGLMGCNTHLGAPKFPVFPLIEVEPEADATPYTNSRDYVELATRDGYRYFRPLRDVAHSVGEGVAMIEHGRDFLIHGRRVPVAAAHDGKRQLVALRFLLPIHLDDLESLKDHGARVVHTLPNNALLVWFDDPDRAAPFFKGAVEGVVAATGFPAPPLLADWHAARDEEIRLEVQLFNDGTQVSRDIASLSGHGITVLHGPEETPDGDFHLLSVRLPRAAMRHLANLPTLLSAQQTGAMGHMGETSGLIVANQTTWVGTHEQPQQGVDYLEWLRGRLGLGPGESPPANAFPIVAVVDSGVGSGNPADPQAPYSPPADFLVGGTGASRIAFNRRWQVPGIDPGVTDCGATTTNAGYSDGHGHFVASMLAGFNDGSGAANADPDGFRYGMGVNPFGMIGSMRLPLAPFVDESQISVTCMRDMVRDYWGAIDAANGTFPAAGNGRTAISTNSWGVIAPANLVYTYDAYAQLYDYLVRDVGGPTRTPRHLAAVFAAGNAGNDGFNTVYSPGLSKNVITAGGSEGVDFRTNIPYCGSSTAYNPYGNDPFRIADNANDMWIYASMGSNTAGARIKPDIAAPASLVYANFPSVLACPLPGETDMVADSVQPRLYARAFGTSFATPTVAASVQLGVHFLDGVYTLSDPSPALLRAYVAHGGLFLTGENTGVGQSGGNPLPLPSPRQGFGRLNLDYLLDPIPRHFVNQTVVFSAGALPLQAYTVTGTVADPTQPVRIVLAWTDPPAPTFGSSQGAIINDLDLEARVAVSGMRRVRYIGNSFLTTPGQGDISQPYPAAAPFQRDRSNNLEAIFLQPPGSATEMTIIVRPYRILRDAFFQRGVRPRQDFALVVSNFIADNP